MLYLNYVVNEIMFSSTFHVTYMRWYKGKEEAEKAYEREKEIIERL